MTSVLQAGKRHFSDKLSEDLKCIEVPEWKDDEGQPVKIYFKSSMRLSQKSRLLKHHSNNEYDKAIACQLIFKCRDENGKPLFTLGQMDQIIDELDPDVCTRIVNEMEAQLPSIDEIKGN